MARRGLNIALVASLLVGSAAAFSGTAASAAAPEGAGDQRTVPGRYIVVLDDSVGDPGAVARDHARNEGARVDFVYRNALRGYSATMTTTAAANISRDPRVAYVEADQVVTAFGEIPTGVDRIDNATTNDLTLANLGIDGTDDQRVDVDVAVIDTGVDAGHADLNVAGGVDCTGSPFNDTCVNTTATDGNGHGTHVAGTIGALDNGSGVVGVAPGARIWSVRVLNNSGSGYMSWIVAGIDWVAAKSTVEVANMSLGCECTSSAMNSAIHSASVAGVTFAVAAGNSGKDASSFSPANHDDVITVSALADGDGKSGGAGTSAIKCRSGETDDRLATFSNYGPDVEVTAPGVCITSTWPGGGLNTISGTSMASPHVAGAAALLASGTSSLSPSSIRSKLIADGNTSDWTDRSDGNKEPRVDVTGYTPAMQAVGGGGGGGGGGDTGNQAPVVSISSKSCSGTTCSFTATATDDGPGSLTYTWAFGDGGGDGGSLTMEHTYASIKGSYTVTFTATDGGGVSSSATTTVSCNARGKNKNLTCS